MTPRRAGRVAAGLSTLSLLVTGCELGTDDELAPPPTRTITASPSRSLAPAPATIPVGQGDVSPSDVVWAQGSVLHVGRRQVDVSPIHVEALVVVDGGVFVLDGGELWFTDLARVRGTGQTDVVALRASADASRLVVMDTRSGQPEQQGYDTHSGRAVRGDVHALAPKQVRDGPGRYELRPSGESGPEVVAARTGNPARLRLPMGWSLGRWLDESTLLGTGVLRGGDRQVVRCSVHVTTCRAVGSPPDIARVVFGTGK